ncbi:MAG: L-2-hydroxyglutarate oxidase [Verrucomicrobiota bacterium]
MTLKDIVVIGGGIIGLSTARALLQLRPRSLVVLEAEKELASHQTGHNSGVIHAGLYYKPGSLKAVNCVEGREAMIRYCEENGIAYERCGKLVVATSLDERPALDELERRGRANGLDGLTRLPPEAMREREPHVAGCDGLMVPQTGIVDFREVANAFARDIVKQGGEIRKGFRVQKVEPTANGFVLSGTGGEVVTRGLINCAGLQCDRVAELCGLEPKVRIVPFRGEYVQLKKEKEHLVRHLIYPVPDPAFPFLGVHFTRMIQGGVEAGPNAVLALKREGYGWSDVSLADLKGMMGFNGFWNMTRRYWKMGFKEMHRSLSKEAFVDSLKRLIPEITVHDVTPHGAGVRAQAVQPDGTLVDDFQIMQTENMVHVLNAPSPAATSSISIGGRIAAMVDG